MRGYRGSESNARRRGFGSRKPDQDLFNNAEMSRGSAGRYMKLLVALKPTIPVRDHPAVDELIRRASEDGWFSEQEEMRAKELVNAGFKNQPRAQSWGPERRARLARGEKP